jgi:hypothetical protein
MHNLSGTDWGGKFVGISKKKWIEKYLKLNENDPAMTCLQGMGEGTFPMELVNGELPEQVTGLEGFVCSVYSTSGPRSLPALRWDLFRSKNLEGEMLPPTRGALLPHLTRANYMSMRDKSYIRLHPNLPPIKENGWHQHEEVYVPVRSLNNPAPQAVLELVKCGCKTGCKPGSRCGCFTNGLPCTPLCKCYSRECENVIMNKQIEEEEDE